MIFEGADNPMVDPETAVAHGDWPLWVRVVAKVSLAGAVLALLWGILVITGVT